MEKFIEVNPALLQIFGYDSKEEILKIRISDLYQNPDDRAKFNEKMLKEGIVKSEELGLKKKDGTPMWGSVTAIAIYDENGNVIGHQSSNHAKTLELFNHRFNKIMLGGNRLGASPPGYGYGNGDSWDNRYYFDDLIINGSRIGPTYFAILAGADTTGPNRPTGLAVMP